MSLVNKKPRTSYAQLPQETKDRRNQCRRELHSNLTEEARLKRNERRRLTYAKNANIYREMRKSNKKTECDKCCGEATQIDQLNNLEVMVEAVPDEIISTDQNNMQTSMVGVIENVSSSIPSTLLKVKKGSEFSSSSIKADNTYRGVQMVGLPFEIAQTITFEDRLGQPKMRSVQSLMVEKLCFTYRNILLTYLALSIYDHEDHTIMINRLLCGSLNVEFVGSYVAANLLLLLQILLKDYCMAKLAAQQPTMNMHACFLVMANGYMTSTTDLLKDLYHDAELFLVAQKTVAMLFLTVLETTGITAFDLTRAIESFIRHEEFLPRELSTHLKSLEEQLLESMVNVLERLRFGKLMQASITSELVCYACAIQQNDVIIKNKMNQRDSIEVSDQQLEPKLEMAAIVQHDFMQINNPQPQVNDEELEPKLEMAAIVQHDFMQINNPQPQPEAEPPVSMELIETYEHLKAEIIDLFQMLKVTRSSSQHLALALQINPSLQLLRQFDQQVEEQIRANLQQELQEFQQNMLWDEIAIHEIAIPWNTD
ncbi:hypothetical protein RHSIM_Rhsim02G0185900 [Rhododendron simsii]|uniref:Retinoblastoma-associated protein A-box domain-containing protein n=1 Tax=Rhododendron simsii TaxID=118357 RepID=A0A834H9H1_RHOSS|nr:hypothetical protein RHSIM_Rhsim02G0185900 [Rhododendron simsii]